MITQSIKFQQLNVIRQPNKLLINLFLGGFSLIYLGVCWLFIDKSKSVYNISQIAFTAAFVTNHPHFLSSYLLMYSDFKKNITQSLKYFWSAVLVPILLFIVFGYALFKENHHVLSWTINVMFFLVGWHYVKQIFGVIIVTSALEKKYYSVSDRNIILLNLFSLWAISFLNSQVYAASYDFYGIRYESFELSRFWLNLSYSVFIATLIYTVAFHIQKYRETKFIPTSSALIGLLSLYAWYVPAFSHPHFAYMIPFFHSIQYLVFVWFFKRNQVNDQISKLPLDQKKQAWAFKFIGFLIMSLVLGASAFEFVPKALDAHYKLSNSQMGSSPYLVCFLLFINIHHYFIDNAIWKSSNPEIKKYLFLS